MCLILVAWRVHPRYPCVVAANRDEFHARPAAPAAWWSDQPHVLAGRDLSAGGTWLGMTRTGRFAALTNYRDRRADIVDNSAHASRADPPRAVPRRAVPPRTNSPRPDPPSRGGLVTGLLESRCTVAEDLAHLREVGAAYNGFNAIVSDGAELGVYESLRGEGRRLAPGIYGLSNHLLDTPWPKVRNAKSRLLAALAEPGDEHALLALLRDQRPAPDHELPDTGLGLEWERLLSSAFVLSPEYGTRCSTLVRIDTERRVCFDEWTWDPGGRETGRARFEFELTT
jgi:uncharacterized protein with NRDE domain